MDGDHPRYGDPRAYQSAAIEERVVDAGVLVLDPGDTRDAGQGVGGREALAGRAGRPDGRPPLL
jgi:hypothetical protein